MSTVTVFPFHVSLSLWFVTSHSCFAERSTLPACSTLNVNPILFTLGQLSPPEALMTESAIASAFGSPAIANELVNVRTTPSSPNDDFIKLLLNLKERNSKLNIRQRHLDLTIDSEKSCQTIHTQKIP